MIRYSKTEELEFWPNDGEDLWDFLLRIMEHSEVDSIDELGGFRFLGMYPDDASGMPLLRFAREI